MTYFVLVSTLLSMLFMSSMMLPAAEQGQRSPMTPPVIGHWDAWLESPGGRIEFAISLTNDNNTWQATLINGEEREPIPVVRIDGHEIIFDFVHYNSTVTAIIGSNALTMQGQWKRRRGLDEWITMDFHAKRSDLRAPSFSPPELGAGFVGRWAVQFSSSEDEAIGVFKKKPHDARNVVGTFMTTIGDYRFLGGKATDTDMTLSVFDGGHAFLFKATLQEDGSLKGDFWSRDAWHETWTARRDDSIQLADPFKLTTINERIELSSLRFPNLDGTMIQLDDEQFKGTCRIIEVFGTWCPNCNDATRLLVDFEKRYKAKGLSILGLAFEVTGSHDLDAAQVQRYIDYHGIEYPILIAGTASKDEASRRLPLLDRIRSYPTFLFLDRDAKVRAVYTGFNGPATGAAHEKLCEDFERLIESMLDE